MADLMPLPNHRIIPTGWVEHHQPVQNAAQTGTAVGREPGTGWVWDPITKTDVPAQGAVRWQASCRAQRLRESTETTAGGQTILTRDYLVQVPAGTVARVGEHVTITTTQGRTWTVLVTDVLEGTEAWGVDLHATQKLKG